MSFSGQVKSELCRTVPAQRCCALAPCFGILLYCNTFTGDGVRIVTESRELGELLPKLFRKAFGFEGTPLRFILRERKKDDADGARG